MWRVAETLEDTWTSPRSDKLYHNVEMPGNAPGLNPRGDLPLRYPCWCDVGLELPHEWCGTCENGRRPTIEKEAASTLNWVLLDNKVEFGRNWWTLVRKLAQELGYDEMEQSYLENSVARNFLPPDFNISVGLIRNDKPQIYASTIDRSWVIDKVLEASQDLNSDEYSDSEVWQEASHNGPPGFDAT